MNTEKKHGFFEFLKQRVSKKTTIIGIVALMLLGIVAIAGSVSANRFGFNLGASNMQGTNTAVQTAIDNNNFNAWKAAIESTLTQTNFDKLVEMHKSMSEKQTAEQAVRDAINSGDYNAYVSAMNTLNNLVSSMTPVNESEFSKLVQQYQAWQGGNLTKGPADQGSQHMGRGLGMGNGFDMGRI
jgi:hypothetical protein